MTTLPQTPVAPAKPKVSGLAIASLICGIAGLCTLGLSAVVGLILGIVALLGIRKSAGQVAGKGFAIAGIVISAGLLLLLLVLLLLALMVPAIMPAFSGAYDKALSAAAMSNARQIGVGALEYASGPNGQLPPGDSWPEALTGGSYVSEKTLAYPPDTGRAFAMNAKLSGLTLNAIKNPSQTVFFFECDPAAPPSGGPEILPPKPRHGAGYIVCFTDGHSEIVTPNHVKNLHWEP